MTCRCHASEIYQGCEDCPACGHHSFDPFALACEREQCGYEVPERLDWAVHEPTLFELEGDG